MASDTPYGVPIYDPFARAASSGGPLSITRVVDVTGAPYLCGRGGDDTSSIHAVMAALSALGGGTAVFPAGNYNVTALTLGTANGLRLFGLPGAVITQYAANALQPVLSVVTSGHVVEGLRITGSITAGHEADEGTGCIQLTYAGAPITLDRITIRGCTFDGKNGGVESYNGAAAFAMTNILLEQNTIRTLHLGIYLGPYGRNAVVNDKIAAIRNDIEVSATGGYANFHFARPLWIINTNNLVIEDNRSIGGFGGIETFGGQSGAGRPRQRNVHISNNRTDGHLGFTQVDGGECSGNAIDMSLRNPAWPTFDDPVAVASWGYLAGIEADDMNSAVVTGNVVRGQVGAGVDFGGCEDSILEANTIDGSGVTGAPPAYAHGVWLNNSLQRSKVVNNVIRNSARCGVGQTVDASFMTMTDCDISGNTISVVKEHGIALRLALGVRVGRNDIISPNGSVGAFDGINFSRTFGGDVVRYAVVEGNRTSGGRYGIYSEFAEAGTSRGSLFSGNAARAVTNGLVSPNSRSYVIQGGRRRLNVAEEISITQSLAAHHMDFSTARDFITLDPGAADQIFAIDYGTLGDIVTINFNRGDTTVVTGSGLTLAGGANVIPTAGSTFTFQCVNDVDPLAETWREVSRTIA